MTILWQLANLQNIYNDLKTYLKIKSYDRLLDVLKTTGQICLNFTFGEDNMLSSADAVSSFGPMHNGQIGLLSQYLS